MGVRVRRSGLQPGAPAQAHGRGAPVKRGSALAKAFAGRWRIAEMDVWDNDYLDLVEPAYIAFKGPHGGALFSVLSKAGSTCVTALGTAPHAPSSPGKGSTTRIQPAAED